MKLTCEHCATPFKQGTGDGDFCCSGCRHVHELIRAEGLADYYALRDRMGRPVGDAAVKLEDSVKWEGIQGNAEREHGELILRVDGMSCLGCVWLIERLCRTEAGVLSARVSLQENRLWLKWRAGAFDLSGLVMRLRSFGYTLSNKTGGLSAQWSMLTWRVILCGIFAVNGLLLALPGILGVEVSAYGNLLLLLSLLFVALSLVVGASHFVIPAVRSWRVGLVHYDSLLVLGMLTLFADPRVSILWELPILIMLLLMVRWVHLRVWGWVSKGGDRLELDGAGSTQAWISLLSMAAVVVEFVLFLQGQMSALFVSAPLYAFAVVGRCSRAVGLLLINVGLCALGWCLVISLGMNHFEALAWSCLSGLLMFANFACWKLKADPS